MTEATNGKRNLKSKERRELILSHIDIAQWKSSNELARDSGQSLITVKAMMPHMQSIYPEIECRQRNKIEKEFRVSNPNLGIGFDHLNSKWGRVFQVMNKTII